jgi:hypothetical protein
MESPWLWLLLVFSIVLLFPLLLVGFWMLICSLLASLARWPALAAQYPARGPAVGMTAFPCLGARKLAALP